MTKGEESTSTSCLLSSLQGQLKDVDNLIVALTTSRSHIQFQLNRLINDTALISSLPHEILSMIFEAGHALQEAQPSGSPFELVVSQVTRAWRTVGMQTPRLWANICISSELRWPCHRAAMYLARSKAVDVDLQIHLHPKGLRGLVISSLCDLILPHVHRWRRFSVDSNSQSDLIALILRLFSATAPRLEHLRIALANPNTIASFETGNVPRNIFAGGVPSLAYVQVIGINLQCCLPPLQSTTTIHLSEVGEDFYTSHHQLSVMLNDLPMLTHLVVHWEVLHSWEPTKTILLPALRLLHIRAGPSGEGREISGFVMTVSAPSLHSLILEGVISQDFNLLVDLPRHPSLRSLTVRVFHDRCFTWRDWMKLIQVLPSVTEVTATCPKHLLRALRENISEDYSPLSGKPGWPRLKLVLEDSPNDLEKDLVETMVARTIAQCPIIDVVFPGSILSDAIKDELER
jgi:hypothetical protein